MSDNRGIMENTMLLDECSDLVLRCSDGRCIPCVRYTCMTTCDVIRHVVEDVGLSTDFRGRLIVPFPNVDSADLGSAIDVIHDVRPVEAMCVAELAAALRGCAALGHGAHTACLLERVWELVKHGTYTQMQPYVSDLLHVTALRQQVLKRLMILRPMWEDFWDALAGVDVDVPLAIFVLQTTSKYYAAGPLFVHLLRELPDGALDAESALSLFSAPRNALAYHPAEVVDVVDSICCKLASRLGAGLSAFLRAVVVANRVYDVAPLLANGLSGTIIMLEHVPSVSLLCVVSERKGVILRKMAPWLSVSIDWNTGVMDALMALSKVDEVGRYARQCQVRFTAYAGDVCGEIWYVFTNINPRLTVSVRNDCSHAIGCVRAYRTAMQSAELTRIRIDVFYGETSVLERAFI